MSGLAPRFLLFAGKSSRGPSDKQNRKIYSAFETLRRHGVANVALSSQEMPRCQVRSLPGVEEFSIKATRKWQTSADVSTCELMT